MRTYDLRLYTLLMDRREFLNAVASTTALPVISALPLPALITPGMSRDAALQIFSEQYGRSFATPEAAEFFFRRVKSVSFLLADRCPYPRLRRSKVCYKVGMA